MWLFLLQPDIGVLANVGWIADLFPVIKSPGLLRDPGTALASRRRVEHLGQPRVHVHPRHRRAAGHPARPPRGGRRSTAPAASAGSGASPCRCSARRCCSCVIVLTTRAFQAYGEIDLLTRGGPRPEDSTTTITYLIYGTDSIITNNIGLQSAVAVLLFLVLLVLSAVQLVGIGRRVHYA